MLVINGKDENVRTNEDLANMAQPRLVIWDTDWLSDCDDTIAARILVWAERMNMVDIVALNTSVAHDNTSPSIEAFFRKEGRYDLVVGVDKQATDYTPQISYHTYLLTLPHADANVAAMEDCVSVYRRAFATAKKPIDIISVGFMNGISRFLQSTGDSISPLTGVQLVQQNGGTLWVMGGDYPTGNENNFTNNDRSMQSANYVFANWTNKIICLGYTAGNSVLTGGTVVGIWGSENDILAKAIADYDSTFTQYVSTNGRNSWDPMLTFLACYGDTYSTGFSLTQGTNVVNASTGENTFTTDASGKHYYVSKVNTDTWFKIAINTILEKKAWGYRGNIGNNSIAKL